MCFDFFDLRFILTDRFSLYQNSCRNENSGCISGEGGGGGDGVERLELKGGKMLTFSQPIYNHLRKGKLKFS